jgi:hypothetical protein
MAEPVLPPEAEARRYDGFVAERACIDHPDILLRGKAKGERVAPPGPRSEPGEIEAKEEPVLLPKPGNAAC